jgi:AraC-like DNA-binding protein
LSVEGFRKRFTRVAGQPPTRYRIARRIDRACELLSSGRATVKEAAAAAGFFDQFHFSRRFKQVTGESPAHFRQRLRPAAR